MTPGKLVILSGPSGVGKDTVLESWRRANPLVERVVAYATRRPREGEIDGVDYHFVSEPDFKRKAAAGEFLEYKEVYGNFYATPLLEMEKMLSDGKVAVLKIDVQGALSAMELRPDALSIFLLPPDPQELVRRIRSRGTDFGKDLEKRIQNAEKEMAESHRYRFRVTNDDLQRVVRELQEIVDA